MNYFPRRSWKTIGLVCLLAVGTGLPLVAGDPTLDRLINNMTTADVVLRDKARNQLVMLCRDGHAELLQPYLTASNSRYRLAALEIAGLIGDAEALVAALGTALGDSDAGIRFQAARSLGRIGSGAAVNALAGALGGQSDASTREAICNAISNSGRPAGASALAGVLGDDSLQVRFAAAKGLWELKAPGQDGAVSSAASAEEDDHVKAWLYAYLVSHGAGGDGLKEFATYRDGLLRDLVIKAYKRAGNPAVCEAWIGAMSHESWRVRFDSARGMSELAQPKHVPDLIKFLEDKHPEVRAMAVNGLRRISGRTCGFQGHDAADRRTAAIGRWKKWWVDSAYRFNLSAE